MVCWQRRDPHVQYLLRADVCRGTDQTRGMSAGITNVCLFQINHNRSFRKFSRRFKVVNMVAMYLGAAAMAILAYWA